MHGTEGRTVCFEGRHGQNFQEPAGTRDERDGKSQHVKRESGEGKAKAEEWAGCGVALFFFFCGDSTFH
jgi:hypothetical protein